MEYNTKLKNKNAGYYLINDRVFPALRQAEDYCNKNNIDVNTIQSGSEEIKIKCKQIAVANKSALEIMEQNLQEMIVNERSEFNTIADDYNRSLESRDLFIDHKRDLMIEHKGILNGLHNSALALFEQMQQNNLIIYLK